jgi:hypothetical protein
MSVVEDLGRRVLRAYARLAPSPRDVDLVCAATDDLVVLPDRTVLPTSTSTFRDIFEQHAFAPRVHLPSRGGLQRLASLDALHRDEVLLRLAWVLIAGTADVRGERRRVLQPLLVRPVTLHRADLVSKALGAMADNPIGADYTLKVAGDVEVGPLVVDQEVRDKVLVTAEFGGGALEANVPSEALLRRLSRLQSWIRTAATEAGLKVDRVQLLDRHPEAYVDRDGLAALVGYSVFVTRSVDRPSVQAALLNWAGRPLVEATAFGSLLSAASGDDVGDETPTSEAVLSPVPLTPSQDDVVRSSRTSRLMVVSGAPGTGKTHTICAVALDAIERGSSVLIATQSRYAADVVAELLDRTPGPDPVRFGDGVAMSRLIDDLSTRMQTPLPRAELDATEDAVTRAVAVTSSLEASITRRLELESSSADAAGWDGAVPALAAAAPGVFDPASDLDRIAALVEACSPEEADGGFLARRRARKRRRELDDLARCAPGTDLSTLRTALAATRSRRAAAELAAFGRDRLPWDELADARAALRVALGRRLAAMPLSPDRMDGRSRSSVGQLVGALRAGRGRRRQLLADLAPGELTSVTPLWIGTLSDIEDVLPAVAGLFDLVVLDEASQIDQPQAAPALLRSRRAVVVGDPHQLRHVSFRSDADVDAALAAEGLTDLRSLLDVRRVSAFDLAAMAAPIRVLRDHFRSVPHLIDFSAERFYRDRLSVMTRNPTTERLDAIDVVHLDHPAEAGDGEERVVPSEVDAVIELVERVGSNGADTTVGVITPFRAQATALEQALVDRVDHEVIESLRLRVGTVHAFQGGERDHVVVATGLTDADGAGRRRFLEDPNLFNVMVTRGRDKVTVVTGYRGSTGLLADYIAWGDGPPTPPPDAGTDDAWTSELAEELGRAGFAVRVGYPVGPWHLDLVVDGWSEEPVVLSTRVGPDARAHLERHLTLVDLGWRVVDAHPGRWGGDAALAAIDLTAALRP